MSATAETVLEFWFGPDPSDPAHIRQRMQLWFSVDREFDDAIRERFESLIAPAAAGAWPAGERSGRETLAAVIVLDQFPRNVYRGSADAFAHDAVALAVCRDGMARGVDTALPIVERMFLYLPFEHAEDADVQHESVRIFSALHDEAPPALREFTAQIVRHAREHCELIERFGRFPHRNAALGRASTREEIEFLETQRGRYGQG